jgi:hypothetical protein
VVLTTKGIDDLALKYFVEAGVLALRRVPKDDLKWVARDGAAGVGGGGQKGTRRGGLRGESAGLGCAVRARRLTPGI